MPTDASQFLVDGKVTLQYPKMTAADYKVDAAFRLLIVQYLIDFVRKDDDEHARRRRLLAVGGRLQKGESNTLMSAREAWSLLARLCDAVRVHDLKHALYLSVSLPP